MKNLLHRLSNNSIVLYTNDTIKTGRSIRNGYIENNVKYYFLTENGLISLNIKNPIYLKRNCSQQELTEKLNEIFNN